MLCVGAGSNDGCSPMPSIDHFIQSLKREASLNVFNPWYDVDQEHDQDVAAPFKRRDNLRKYLHERKGARYMLLAEAIGYQGGHFSGIAMTSERMLLGHMEHKGISPEHLVCQSTLVRTSKVSVRPKGFTEPTATIAWGKIIELKLDTRDFIFWNMFPWHPYHPEKGLLSNRTPADHELKEGREALQVLIRLANIKTVIAVGNKSKGYLDRIGISAPKVRHPANGGAKKFREQLERLVR